MFGIVRGWFEMRFHNKNSTRQNLFCYLRLTFEILSPLKKIEMGDQTIIFVREKNICEGKYQLRTDDTIKD